MMCQHCSCTTDTNTMHACKHTHKHTAQLVEELYLEGGGLRKERGEEKEACSMVGKGQNNEK